MRPKRTESGAFRAVVCITGLLAAGSLAADDAGKGAAWGAAAGLIAGRRHARRAQAEVQETAAVQTVGAQEATQEQIDGFKKAFSACMEGKNYIAKF